MMLLRQLKIRTGADLFFCRVVNCQAYLALLKWHPPVPKNGCLRGTAPRRKAVRSSCLIKDALGSDVWRKDMAPRGPLGTEPLTLRCPAGVAHGDPHLDLGAYMQPPQQGRNSEWPDLRG